MKYFIIGPQASGKQEIVDSLEKMGVACGKLFSNIDKCSPAIYNSNNYELYTTQDVNDVFENNAYVFIQPVDIQTATSINNYYEGLSRYTFDNNDVFTLSPDQFMSISPNILKGDEVCFIWLDNLLSVRKRKYFEDKRTYNFMAREEVEKRDYCAFTKALMTFNNAPVLYFTNEEPCRVTAIIYSLIKHPDLFPIYKACFND